MKKILLLLFFTASLTCIFAQNAPAKIKMNADGESSIKLSNLSIDVSIVGNIATTTFDMIFSNSSNRILEGEFEFPLDNGQTVTRYALDINGKLREGVVVEKEKGREVFETIVRQNIDPGLVEMTAGNNFKTRVYPIPANGSRHVVIAYEQELKYIDGKKTYILQPLTDSVLDKFEFNINLYKSSFKQENTRTTSFETLSLDDWNNSYNAYFEKEKYTQTKPISFALPEVPENTTYTQTQGTDTYFYYFVPLKGETRNKRLPSSIAIYYDISASTEKKDKAREFQLLEKYLTTAGTETVFITTFSNEIHETKQFNKKPFSEIKAYLEKQVYDGATNLSCLDFESCAGKVDEILLFSDGMGNWKKDLTSTASSSSLNSTLPVITINSSSSANHSMLSMIASKNSGIYINLCSTTNEEAFDLLSKETYRLLNVEYDKNKFSDVYPTKGEIINGSFSMAGILKKKNGTITLSFGYGATVTEHITVDISSVKSIEAPNIQRLWAQKKIENLSVFYDDNKTEIMELAKKYNIVTKDTSLIVLDSVADYVRYGITPPDELKAEYNKLVRSSTKSADDNSIPKSVYTNFEEFQKWWNTTREEFKAKKVKKQKAKAQSNSIVRREAVESGSYSNALGIELNESASSRNLTYTDNLFLASEAPDTAYEDRAMEMETNIDFQDNNQAGTKASIALQGWSPDNDYLTKLKKTSLEDMYKTYIEMRPVYASSPSFFMETSDYFFEEGLNKEAFRILSNLAEMETENSDILRALGNKLVEHKDYENAIWVFEKLTKIRSEIPQFFRDLAMAYYYNGNTQQAVDTLYYTASRSWDSRFESIQQIALNDMNCILALKKKGEKIDTSKIDKKLMQNFPVDIRIVLTWNTDNCDIDLWVTDPDDEKCYYANKITANGGHMSRDFTRGYGPEEFCIKEAPEGTYKIEANYYGTTSQKMLQPVIIQAEVFTNFGKPNQKREVLTLQLDSVKGVFTIGTITFEK